MSEQHSLSDHSAQSGHKQSPETDEVLRRIGRNMIHLQQTEYLLKHLVAHRQLQGYASQLEEQRTVQITQAQKLTMGQLVNSITTAPPVAPTAPSFPDQIEEPYISVSCTYEAAPSHPAGFADELRTLTEKRNELVHHFLARWVAATEGNVDSTLTYLDAQLDEIKPIKQMLAAQVEAMHTAGKLMANFLSSPEGTRQMELLYLQSSCLVGKLTEIAHQRARPDGWTLLSSAGNIIRREAPEALARLQQQLGYANLKQVLLAAACFDVEEEPLPNGNSRTIYRLSPGLQSPPPVDAAQTRRQM